MLINSSFRGGSGRASLEVRGFVFCTSLAVTLVSHTVAVWAVSGYQSVSDIDMVG